MWEIRESVSSQSLILVLIICKNRNFAIEVCEHLYSILTSKGQDDIRLDLCNNHYSLYPIRVLINLEFVLSMLLKTASLKLILKHTLLDLGNKEPLFPIYKINEFSKNAKKIHFRILLIRNKKEMTYEWKF